MKKNISFKKKPTVSKGENNYLGCHSWDDHIPMKENWYRSSLSDGSLFLCLFKASLMKLRLVSKGPLSLIMAEITKDG